MMLPVQEEGARPLSEMNKSERYSQSRTDTLIGSGMRAEGNIIFTGLLRIHGDVIGDVSCASDAQGTLVVGDSGSVAGTLEAPHIVVSGKVSGPVHSSESIEIRPGACVAGDVDYQSIDIHAGGMIEGSLTHRENDDGHSPAREPVAPTPKNIDLSSGDRLASGGGFVALIGDRRRAGAIAALLVAAVAITLIGRSPAPGVTPAESPPAEPVAASRTTAIPATQEAPQPVASTAGPSVPGATADSRRSDQASAPELPDRNSTTVVAVQGVNPAKPAGVFLVIVKEPAVLFRKKRQDAGAGTRIELVQGATESIAIGRNEIFRVASGRDITIYYQGRKVTPKTIESGAWMSFVPQSASSEK